MPPKKKIEVKGISWNKFNLDGWWSPAVLGK